MKVLNYEAYHVMGLEEVKFDLQGHYLFLVGGKNAQGKTSALLALLMALCGRSGCDYPEVALKEGEKEGWVKCQLEPDASDTIGKSLSIELLMKRKRDGTVAESFRILDENDQEAPQPRQLLQRFCALRAFDPLAFEKMGRKEKAEVVRKLVGLDFTEQKKQYDRLYKERADVNRDAKRLEAQYTAMERHADAPEQEVSVSALMAELSARQGVNAMNAGERNKLGNIRVAGEIASKEIADLETKLAFAKARLNDCREQYTKQKAIVDSLKDADEAEVKQQIQDADATNRKVRQNAQRAQLASECSRLELQAETLNKQMDAITQAQQAALSNAKWPVEGLAFDEDGVLYNGLPFEQASKSVRTLTSVKIGMALNPKLRVLVCQDGNDLDNESLATLGEFLKENDFQMVLEMITRDEHDEERCQVVIHDGKVKKSRKALDKTVPDAITDAS
jgi:hypothetical protein